MKRRVLLTVIAASMLLLPAVATAAVVINNPINFTASHSATNNVYVTTSSGYTVAHDEGFITVTGNNNQYTNLTVALNSVSGQGDTVLLNILQIQNNNPGSASVNVWFNGTLPSGVTMYLSQSQMTYNGATVSGQQWNSGESVHLSGTGTALYISFVLTGNATGKGTINMQDTTS